MGDLPRACLSGAEGAGAVTGGLGSWAGRVMAMGNLEWRCVCVSCLCQLYSVLYCHLCIVDGSLSSFPSLDTTIHQSTTMYRVNPSLDIYYDPIMLHHTDQTPS
jgi:hypothetical protein